jgi:hypothetical protein
MKRINMNARGQHNWFALLFLVIAVIVGARVVVMSDVSLSHAKEITTPAVARTNPADAYITPTGLSSPVFLTSVSTSSANPLLGLGINSISDSTVTTEGCYESGNTQSLCFAVHNGSTDAEWLTRVRLTFPALLGAWTVSCNWQDTTDSSGNPVHFDCHATDNEVVYTDNDSDGFGEVTAGSSWGFCVDVTVPGAYFGPRVINWGLSGDNEPGSDPPHDITAALNIKECTPLMLKPDSLSVEGCNGVTQTHTFEMWNNSGNSGTFALTYDVYPEGSLFTGPSSLDLAAGEIVTFTVWVKPDFFLKAGERVTATLQASGGGFADGSTIANTITDFAGWQGRVSSPVPTMDNVVVWASYQDGGLWSIGGYGAKGATQRYDPESDTWITHTVEMSPTIEYPMDGCYGLNDAEHETVVLFPDTILTGTLHIYDITADGWYTKPVPIGFPDGRWGQDIVSLLSVPGVNQNLCYISGGSTQEGGGRVKNLWRYRPDLNQTEYLGNFTFVNTGFNFHASWYVPWVGDDGAICVGGGIDFKSNVVNATQCYDLKASQFNGPNANLGPLPEPRWGMADGWQFHDGRYQIWIANGVAQGGTLLPTSAYADETTGGFVRGPDLPVALYRLEGDGWMGHFYTEGGAAGGFSYSAHNQLLMRCPECHEIYLPLTIRD